MEGSNTNSAILGLDVGNRMDYRSLTQVILDTQAKYGIMAGGAAYGWGFQLMSRSNPHAATIGFLGNPTVQALVVANLHDSQTSYRFSNNMHHAFPAGVAHLCESLGKSVRVIQERW